MNLQTRKEKGLYIDETTPVVSDIKLFMHCKKCCEEKPDNVSTQEYSWIEVGKTETGIQVWCIRHNEQVTNFNITLLAQRMLEDALVGDRCDECLLQN